MDENVQQVASMVGNLRNMAIDMVRTITACITMRYAGHRGEQPQPAARQHRSQGDGEQRARQVGE